MKTRGSDLAPAIPIARPDISQDEIDAVAAVLRTDVLGLGPRAEEFERGLAAEAGRRFGIACSSGTAALHVIVSALGIGPGSEVITTPFSFVASAKLDVAAVATTLVDVIDGRRRT